VIARTTPIATRVQKIVLGVEGIRSVFTRPLCAEWPQIVVGMDSNPEFPLRFRTELFYTQPAKLGLDLHRGEDENDSCKPDVKGHSVQEVAYGMSSAAQRIPVTWSGLPGDAG
jgi:hypothetical protein